MTELTLALLGLAISVATLLAILWSVVFPERRIWPPQSYTQITPFVVWIPTFTLFGVLVVLGVMDWSAFSLPTWVRFGLGVPLIVAGNIVVWNEVRHFGVPQTGGARGQLRTDGLYRFSRNPQYMADIAMVVGWILISCSLWAVVVGASAIASLIMAPFAEESWLREQYGDEYEKYRSQVSRYFGVSSSSK